MPVFAAGLCTVMLWQATVIVYGALVPVQPLLSVTVTVMVNVPGTCGEPETTPALESVRPAGSAPLAMVKVAVPMAPLWPNAALNGESTVPVELEGLVTVMVWQLIVSV